MLSSDLKPLQELKNRILANNVDSSLYIFECEDNYFLAYQYVNAIAKIRHLEVDIIYDNFDSVVTSAKDDLFVVSDDSVRLLVYECKDVFTTNLDKSQLDNVIVLCKKNETSFETIKMPKLVDWQVIDYMLTRCKGLSKEECSWLYDNIKSKGTSSDYLYRIDSELSKISCFDTKEQSKVFNELSLSNGYSDLSVYNIFNLINAITKKDYLTISKILSELEGIDIDVFGLITLLHKNFKQIIDVQLGKNVTCESLNMSQKQFNAIKYNSNKYTQQEIISIFKFLTEVDYKLKSGLLDLSSDRFLDYILINVIV